jgi:DNA-binding CsgD family transcriptional regulator
LLDGRAGVLLVEGEAGIGKTSLWQAAVARARDSGYRVLSSRAAQAEAQVSFAAVADLLADAGDALGALAEPQRRALEVALLLRDPGESPPELGAIAFALLSVLRGLSGRALVAVDDAQWLDPPSAAALQFALRRGPCPALISARSDGRGPVPLELDKLPAGALERMRLTGLRAGGLQRLLRARLGVSFPRHLLRRVHELSGGNPFFALELARLASDGGDPVHGELPLPRDLHELTRARLEALPPATLEALAVASALRRPTLALVEAATGGDATRALRAAADANVAWVDGGEVRFAHPLLARAAYEEMGPTRRRATHRRLAALAADAEERGRHLAIAADGPDEQVAAALDAAAAAARARGARDAAALLLQRALDLTPAGGSRVPRALAASGAFADAGDWARARALAARAVDAAPAGPARAEALLQLASCHDDPLPLAERARAEAGDDPALRARVGVLVADRRLLVDMGAALADARAAVVDAELSGDAALLAQALTMRAFLAGATLAEDPFVHLDRAQALEAAGARVPQYFSAISSLAIVRMWRDELDEARELFGVLLARARAGGDEQAAVFPLQHLSMIEWRAGRLDAAERHVTEALEAWEASGDPQGLAALLGSRAAVEALRGDHDAARATIAEAAALGVDDELAALRRRAQLGFMALTEGRPADALAELAALPEALAAVGIREPGIVPCHGDLIEALVAAGHGDEAAALVTELQAIDRPRPQVWARRGQGLLAAAAGDIDRAAAELAGALEAGDALPCPQERARTLLELGRVQRRAKRRGAARTTLAEAAEAFTAVGARRWTERARAELDRVGGRAPSRDALTSAEQRVAALVAAGRTNKEVAAELFVSVHTVEAALTRVYGKLGVRSRSELAARFKH